MQVFSLKKISIVTAKTWVSFQARSYDYTFIFYFPQEFTHPPICILLFIERFPSLQHAALIKLCWLSLGTQGDNQSSLLHLADLFYRVLHIYPTTQNTPSKKPFWEALHRQSMKIKPKAFQGFFANSILQSTNFSFGGWILLK